MVMQFHLHTLPAAGELKGHSCRNTRVAMHSMTFICIVHYLTCRLPNEQTGVIWSTLAYEPTSIAWIPKCATNGARLPKTAMPDLNLPSQGRNRDC